MSDKVRDLLHERDFKNTYSTESAEYSPTAEIKTSSSEIKEASIRTQ